jgi:beta-glucosidase
MYRNLVPLATYPRRSAVSRSAVRAATSDRLQARHASRRCDHAEMMSIPGDDHDNGTALDAKASLTAGADYWSTAAPPDLGIRSIRMADGPHGLRVQDDDNPDHLGLGRSLPATCFPPAVTLASTWDPALIRQVGEALGREALSQGVDVVLGPGINIKRSPLCGRNFEYYSEDPLLAGRLASAMVAGLQSQGVAACVKHFAVNNQETDRLRVSADVDERALREIYLRAFEVVVREADSWTVMSAYNRINGVPASENFWLLTELLRGEWGFAGAVVSDWGAVRDSVAAVEAGLDVRMPGPPPDTRVAAAVTNGSLSEEVVEKVAARLRLLAERIAASRPAAAEMDEEAHHQVTRRAASQGAVLLHNDAGLLPVDPSRERSIAVIGELARTPRYQGAGSSAVNPRRLVTGLEALQSRLDGVTDVTFSPGYAEDGDADADTLVKDAVALAADTSLVLIFLGLPPAAEAEGRDRTSIELPANQVELLRAVAAVNPRVVVALSNGSPVTTAGWRNTAGAIVEFWLTGQAHGETIADVLLGEVNPSGKLTETVPVRLEDTPSYLNFPGEHGHVRYGEGIYVGYRWYDARAIDVDYPFGHGLSYTTFDYSDLEVTVRELEDPVAFTIALTITNSGSREGAEVVQVYVGDHSGALQMPVRELRGLAKVRLPAGASERVTLDIRRNDLQHVHPEAGWIFTGGEMEVCVGSSSRDLRLRASIEVPGHADELPLTLWSPFREWLAHPVAGPAVRQLIDDHGGVRGRMGDLLGDPVGRDSVLGNPMLALSQFPGFPINEADAEAVLAGLGGGSSQASGG